ncbi:MAG TPA: TetR/AcrR family transcriptional regulator [Acidimicrobiia bacterium]|nr:TetR/AcrR family transcriptional regulator [Acidimicrobiia bacterium]
MTVNPEKILRTTAPADGAGPKAPARTRAKKSAEPAAKKRLPASERRAQLIDVARDVFLKSGREGVSTHQIADAAGVNVALLYQHFRSSTELFDVAVLRPLVERLEERLAQAKAAGPAAGPPRKFLAEMHVELLGLLVEVAPMLSIALFGDQAAGRQFYLDHIEPLIQEWLTATYRRLDASHRPADPAMVAKAVFGIHITLALYANLLSVTLDVAAVARDVSDFVYLGFFEPA